jgi:hypothetical protein
MNFRTGPKITENSLEIRRSEIYIPQSDSNKPQKLPLFQKNQSKNPQRLSPSSKIKKKIRTPKKQSHK